MFLDKLRAAVSNANYVYQHPLKALNRKQRRSAHHFDPKLKRDKRRSEPAQVLPAQMTPAVRKGLDARGRTVYASGR